MEKPPLLFRHPSLFRRAFTWFPPYWGTVIRLTEVAPDFSRLVVTMCSTVLNRNAFGTHFGGSLYSMCDPFYCLMLVALLGPVYVVWDQAARIEFIQPGRGQGQAVFDWSDTQIDAIRAQAEGGQKVLPEREVLITDEGGNVVARVHKTLYVRQKKTPTPPSPMPH